MSKIHTAQFGFETLTVVELVYFLTVFFCLTHQVNPIRSFDDKPLPSAAKPAQSPFDWGAPPAAKSFDDMPIPTAAKASQPIGFSQIAQRSKGSSICFGGDPVSFFVHFKIQ